MKRGRGVLAAVVLLIVLPGTRRASAQCFTPVDVIADVGVNISTSGARASAPGDAKSLGLNGQLCYNWAVYATTTLRQESPAMQFTESHTGSGQLVFTLDAPAQIGSCYSATMIARSFDQRDEDHAGPSCWIVVSSGPYVTTPPRNPDEGKESPIILDLGQSGYSLTSVENGVRFDIRADGVPVQIAWTSANADNAFLALDRSGNGTIDDGSELFGNATPLASGAKAPNGFEALAELDLDQNGVIDESDPAWANLLLWTDADHDGISAANELQPVAASSVTALETAYRRVGRKDRWGNSFRYMAHARLRYAGGEIRRTYYDLFLRTH